MDNKIKLLPETIELHRMAVKIERPILQLLKAIAKTNRRTMGGMVETLIIEEAKRLNLITNDDLGG